MFTFMCYKLL